MSRKNKSKSILHWLDWFSDSVYGWIRLCFLGRWMTAYQRVNGRMQGGDTGDRPLTGWRLRTVRAMERNPVTGAFRAVGQALFDMPMWVLGLFGLVYGASGLVTLAVYNFYLLSAHLGEMDLGGMMRYGVIGLVSAPLMASRRPLSETLYRCRLTRRVLIWLLGVPKDRFLRSVRPTWGGLPIILTAISLITGVGSALLVRFGWLSYIPAAWHPLLVPQLLLLLALSGMILAVPETGVVLSCCSMAFLWTRTEWSLWLLLTLIVATWIGYAVQLLQAHRTLRFDLLDRVVLLFGLALLFGGLVGYRTGIDSAWRAVVLFALLSLYFLIVNLMVTRIHVKRCWVGVCITSVLVTLSMLARYVDPAELSWLEAVWHKAGPVLSDGFASVVGWLSGGDAGEQVMLLVMTVPLICAFLLRSRRLLIQTGAVALLVTDLVLIVSSGSRGAFVAVLAGLLLLALLSHHRTLTVAVVATPALASVWLWSPLLPTSWTTVFRRLEDWMASWGGLYVGDYWDGIIKMIKTHPAGIGIGDGAFESLYLFFADTAARPTAGCGNLYLELLVTLGIPGLLLFGAVVFFFVQKTLTGVRYNGGSMDRVLLLGGLGGLFATLLLGVTRSIGNGVTVFFGFWVVLALISAYGNVIRIETETVQAHRMGTSDGQDFVGRVD